MATRKWKRMYDDISETLHQAGQVYAIVIGDFKSIVGEGSTNKKVVGPFGLSKRNERGKKLNFCT